MRCAVGIARTFAECMSTTYDDGNKGGQPIVDTRIEQVFNFTRLSEAVQARTGSRGQEQGSGLVHAHSPIHRGIGGVSHTPEMERYACQ
jgi:hypothetical protein